MKFSRALAGVLAAVGAASTLTACSAAGGEDGLRQVSVATAPTYVALPLYLGADVFREHGIELDLVEMSGGGAIVSAAASGSVDVADNITPSLIGSAVAKGEDLAYFCGQSVSFFADILVPPGSGIPTVDEAGSWQKVMRSLEGKTIGVITLGGSADMMLRAALEEAGVDVESVTIVSSGVGAAAVTSLQTGQVDVLYGYPFITQRLVAEGSAEVAVALHEHSPTVRSVFSAGFAAPRTWIEDNGRLARDFCTAFDDAVVTMLSEEGRPQLDASLTERYQLESDTARGYAYEILADLYSTELEKKRLDATFELLGNKGVVPADAGLSYDTTVLLPNVPME